MPSLCLCPHIVSTFNGRKSSGPVLQLHPLTGFEHRHLLVPAYPRNVETAHTKYEMFVKLTQRHESCPPHLLCYTARQSQIGIYNASCDKDRRLFLLELFWCCNVGLVFCKAQNNPGRLLPAHSLFSPRTPSITMREVLATD